MIYTLLLLPILVIVPSPLSVQPAVPGSNYMFAGFYYTAFSPHGTVLPASPPECNSTAKPLYTTRAESFGSQPCYLVSTTSSSRLSSVTT